MNHLFEEWRKSKNGNWEKTTKNCFYATNVICDYEY